MYPGVLEFYDSLKHEPFDLRAIPVTTLSARPNPIAGKLEEASLEGLVKLSGEKLCPSALSGALVSAAAGTVETVLRAELDPLSDKIPHGQEEKIGEVKFENFSRFSEVYPEYRYVFVGDSGQADALTAQLMVTRASPEGTSRVVTTFIHDLRQADNDERSVSPAFRNLSADIVIKKTSTTGRGVIVFRNYIDAAIVAHMHSATLENLITAEGLARITRAALKEFQEIDFQGKEASGKRLREQYRQDAEEACKLLTMSDVTRVYAMEIRFQREVRRVLHHPHATRATASLAHHPDPGAVDSEVHGRIGSRTDPAFSSFLAIGQVTVLLE